jgi:hypothetical protein
MKVFSEQDTEENIWTEEDQMIGDWKKLHN